MTMTPAIYMTQMQQLTYQLVAVQLLKILPHFAGPRFLPSCSPLPNQRVSIFAASVPFLLMRTRCRIFRYNQLMWYDIWLKISFFDKNVMSSFDFLILTSLNKLAVRTSSNSVLRIVHVGVRNIFVHFRKCYVWLLTSLQGISRLTHWNICWRILGAIPSLPSVQYAKNQTVN